MTVKQAVRYMTSEDVAESLGTTPKNVRNKAVEYVQTQGRRGLRGFQTGPKGRWRFRPSDVEAFAEGRLVK
ncbi:excise [Gordonia phage Neville]|uniref:Excise n=2 Tax=Nevillevirus TaxID=3044773 RepID=A0A515MGY6_9CAUD|nr:excise [Gordonia phage Neville]YP_010246027.1 excise [Gordonia phage Trax]AXQ64414.1 excise [Gordonia phage Neville]QDM55929.1 excise [Gordonia phage Trax]